jgi:hypothetical protein
MYDAVDLAAIPDDADLVGAYVNGRWPTYAAAVARFGAAKVVSIAVSATDGAGDWVEADVLDVENGDADPVDAPGWTQAMRALKRQVIANYFSLDRGPAVNDAFAVQGVARCDSWVADWTGEEHLVPGSVSTQYANPPKSGGNFDVSLTNGVWPNVSAPGPIPAPSPPPSSGGFVPPTLQDGAFNDAVKNLQRLLNVHDAGLRVDGVFGPLTLKATENFQTMTGLSVDGIVGPLTWTKLIELG